MPITFSGWLLRPYLDLGPLAYGPLHAHRVVECWRAFSDPNMPYLVAQRTLEPAFRRAIAAEAGLPEHAVTDPVELPHRLRTDSWQAMCEARSHWSELPSEHQCRLLALLHALCLYECVLHLVPTPMADAGPQEAEIAYWRAFAQYLLSLPARTADYKYADMSAFERLVLDGPKGTPAHFNSAIRVFVHKVKTEARTEDVCLWARHLERAVADGVAGADCFTAELLKSRYYRAIGFIPQRQGDRAETVRIMDLAERHAYALRPRTPVQTMLYGENLHALMESRTKEAIWLGDLDLALMRSCKVVDADPYDSKAWCEVGEVRMHLGEWKEAAEAYSVAALLGPPASALARHMAGVCFGKLGYAMSAALLFKDALDIDPDSISPREALGALGHTALGEAVNGWIQHAFDP